MALPNEGAAIHLRQDSKFPNNLYQVAGMIVLLCCLLCLTIPLKGKISELFFPGLALLSLVLGRFLEKMSQGDFVVLYPDRFEQPSFRGANRIVHWNQVTALRWPGRSEDDQRLWVHTKEIKTPFGSFALSLSNLRPEDRLTFIRYVRQVAEKVPQERWPSFCLSVAVPQLKKIEKTEGNSVQGDAEPRTPGRGTAAFSSSHPFLAGLVMPVVIAIALTQVISRKTFWTIASILTLSGFINIRLVWGAWVEPFTKIVLGFAAALFVLGTFSLNRGAEACDSDNSPNVVKVLGYLVLSLIGIPLSVNALEKGWLPRNMAEPLHWLTLGLLFMPIFLSAWGQRRRDGRILEDQEKEALAYWDARERLK